ncbi:MAG: T9SS type A sorting domain-containing protein [Vicingaceae bacterium]|nr:T9SS type A sorting domain-containing protein [Vicingaceae bacterium]
MKKLITLFTLTIATVCSFAQITITNVDMPAVSDTFRLSTTVNTQGLDPVLTGPNFSWNFSTLVPDSQQVDTFFTVASTPALYQLYFNNPFFYPGYDATYAKRGFEISFPQVTVSEVFNYTKNTPTAFDNVGFGANINGIPASVQNIPIDKEYEFPLTYTNGTTSTTSLSEFELTIPTLGHYGQNMERVTTVDGWGSLVLPNGTYNVLRVKSVLNRVDTVYVDQFGFGFTTPRPEEIEYKWLAAGTGMPVLKMISNAGVVSQIEYQDDYVAPVSVRVQSKINNVVVFPNPTKHHLVIDYNSSVSGNLKVNLKDVLGKNIGVVYQNFTQKGTSKLIVNLAQHSIQPGIYFMELVVDDKMYYTEKVVVVE